jgi:hypothetical protein
VQPAEATAGTLNSPPGIAPVAAFKATGLFSATGTVTLKRCSLSSHYRRIADPGLASGHDVLHLKYGQSTFTQFPEASSCNGSYANRMPYTITGSARLSHGAHGPVTLTPAASTARSGA